VLSAASQTVLSTRFHQVPEVFRAKTGREWWPTCGRPERPAASRSSTWLCTSARCGEDFSPRSAANGPELLLDRPCRSTDRAIQRRLPGRRRCWGTTSPGRHRLAALRRAGRVGPATRPAAARALAAAG